MRIAAFNPASAVRLPSTGTNMRLNMLVSMRVCWYQHIRTAGAEL
jgi:hypothetical protein